MPITKSWAIGTVWPWSTWCERGCPCLSMEAYGSGHNEYAAGQHLVRQAIDLLQARPQGDFPELLPAV